MAKPPIDKVRIQNRWLREVCDHEPLALSLCRPIDLMAMEPEVILAEAGQMMTVFDYWRVVLSSEPQQARFSGAGRTAALIVRDKISGGILGVVALSDPPLYWTQLMNHLNWASSVNSPGGLLRQQHQHRVFMMRRCLPVYEFGQMVGGKLLALIATSSDVMRLLELRYSFQFWLLGIRTLHGKGSQYNRLHDRGIELIDVDDTGHGFYAMELRKGARACLRGEKDKTGKTAMYTLAEQVQYWKTRWLPSRMESLGVGPLITPDPNAYRLSGRLDAKKLTLAHLEKPAHVEDPDEEVDTESQAAG